ncbi:MAG: hypothetical protein QOJ42_7773 [Acidobacteriaceae bacterium]|nr:hypothetical protein [Acidobacteriaceae bacterium]
MKEANYGTPCRSSGYVTPHYIDAQFVFRTINQELSPRPTGGVTLDETDVRLLTEFFLLLRKWDTQQSTCTPPQLLISA